MDSPNFPPKPEEIVDNTSHWNDVESPIPEDYYKKTEEGRKNENDWRILSCPRFYRPKNGSDTIIVDPGSIVITSEGDLIYLATTALSIIQGIYFELGIDHTPRELKTIVGDLVKHTVNNENNMSYTTFYEVCDFLKEKWIDFCDNILKRQLNVQVRLRNKWNNNITWIYIHYGDDSDYNYDRIQRIEIVLISNNKLEQCYLWTKVDNLPSNYKEQARLVLNSGPEYESESESSSDFDSEEEEEKEVVEKPRYILHSYGNLQTISVDTDTSDKKSIMEFVSKFDSIFEIKIMLTLHILKQNGIKKLTYSVKSDSSEYEYDFIKAIKKEYPGLYSDKLKSMWLI